MKVVDQSVLDSLVPELKSVALVMLRQRGCQLQSGDVLEVCLGLSRAEQTDICSTKATVFFTEAHYRQSGLPWSPVAQSMLRLSQISLGTHTGSVASLLENATFTRGALQRTWQTRHLSALCKYLAAHGLSLRDE